MIGEPREWALWVMVGRCPRGLATLTEALGRVGIETVPTRLERAYNAARQPRCRPGAWSASHIACAARSAMAGLI